MSKLKNLIKRKTVSVRMRMDPVSYWAHRGAAVLASGQPVEGVLIIGDGDAYTSDQQFAPLSRNLGRLRKTNSLIFRHVKWSAATRHLTSAGDRYSMVWIAISHVYSETLALQRVQSVAHICRARGIRLIYWDGTDDLSVVWPSVVDEVDLYVKKHIFALRTDYERPYRGRTNLTEYAYGLPGSTFSTQPANVRKLNKIQVAKVVAGWNIGLDDKIARLSRRSADRRPWQDRPIDVMCRASNAETGSLLHALRQPATDAMSALRDQYVVLLPGGLVSQRKYYAEMLASKMCVSPFGYGEICWRDFEAALCGCLILKPDMSHVETKPDLFQAGVTYVPLRWDYSNLAETVRYYLEHPDEAKRISSAAREVVLNALDPEWVSDRLRMVLHQLDTRVARN